MIPPPEECPFCGFKPQNKFLEMELVAFKMTKRDIENIMKSYVGGYDYQVWMCKDCDF